MHKGLRNIDQVIALFCDLDPLVQARTIATFVVIADHEGDPNMKDIERGLGLVSSSTSRNVAALTKHHRLGKPGLDLVETYVDPDDGKAKKVRLTPKGDTLKRRIMKITEV